MTTVANSFPSRLRPKALFLGSLPGGYDAQESLNFLSSKYRTLAFQFFILLSAANCLMGQGSPTVVRPGLNLANSQSLGQICSYSQPERSLTLRQPFY